MDYFTTIQVFTTSKDYQTYNGTHLRSPIRPTISTFFPNYNNSERPFNTDIAQHNEQPILDLLFELCTAGKIIITPTGSYEILDLSSLQSLCLDRYIKFTRPPTPTFSSPTDNPVYYTIAAEYYNILAAAHRQAQADKVSTNYAPRDYAAVSERYAASLIPAPIVNPQTVSTAAAAVPQPDTTATKTLEASDSDYYESESSYETVVHPTDDRGNVLSTYRLTSYNVAAKNWNYKQERLKLADPTHTYTPREIKVAPIPRKRPPKCRRPNNLSY